MREVNSPVAAARASRLADERRAEGEVLRRLSATGRTLDGVVRALDWPTGGVGVGAVLRRLAGDGRAHERGGLWYAGPHPSPASSPPVVVVPRPAERAPGLTLGPATLPRRSAPLPRTTCGPGHACHGSCARHQRCMYTGTVSLWPADQDTAEVELLVDDPPLTPAGPDADTERVVPVHVAEPSAARPGADRPGDMTTLRDRLGLGRAPGPLAPPLPEEREGIRAALVAAEARIAPPAPPVEDQVISAAESPVEPVPGAAYDPIGEALEEPPQPSSAAWPVDQVLAVLREDPWPTTREIAVQLGMHTALVSAVLRELRRTGAVCSTGRTAGVRWSLWSEPDAAPAPDTLPDVRACRVCGCTDNDCTQCVDAQGYPCAWVADDLCSRCVVDLTVRRLEDLAVEAEAAAAHLREVVASLRVTP